MVKHSSRCVDVKSLSSKLHSYFSTSICFYNCNTSSAIYSLSEDTTGILSNQLLKVCLWRIILSACFDMQAAVASQFWTSRGRSHFRQGGGQLRRLLQKLTEQLLQQVLPVRLPVDGESQFYDLLHLLVRH